MYIYEAGCENEKAMVIIHGACMSYNMMREIVQKVKDRYHIYNVGVPGMDPNSDEEFTSIEDISDKIEQKLIEKGVKEIECLYGLSMGGALVIRLLANHRIPVKKALIDAGITPYELPYLQTRAILFVDVASILLVKMSKKLLLAAMPEEKYGKEGMEEMYKVIKHMSFKTIKNVFDSTDNYTMPKQFPKMDTKIAYWYGSEERKARKLDIEYVKKHIPNVVFREIKGYDHGQYALCKTNLFVKIYIIF